MAVRGPKKGSRRDPTADSKHRLYYTYRLHKRNPLCQWPDCASFLRWAEHAEYNPDAGDRITLQTPQPHGFSPGVVRAGKSFSEPPPVPDAGVDPVESELRDVWADIHNKCYTPIHPMYRVVGATGIRVAIEWMEFGPFFAWATSAGGFEPGYELLRYDRSKDFSPDNCVFLRSAV